MKTVPFEERIGEYSILKAIGAGGHSRVFEAWDQRRNRSVAIKVLHGLSTSPTGALKLVETEVATMGQFDGNPNIVTVHDHGLHNGAPYIVMTYYDAGNVRDRIKVDGPADPDEVLACGCDMARALIKLHEKNVVHRDIKPANIFMSESRYVLGDFGISSHSHELHERRGEMTPAFASPEAIQHREQSSKADIYSLGATLYFMLTARRPFEVPDDELEQAILYRSPAPIERDDVPEALVGLVTSMLSKHPSERPMASKLLERLLAMQGASTGTIRRPSLPPRPVPVPAPESDLTVVRPRRSFRPVWWALGAVAAVGLLGAVAGLLNGSDDTSLADPGVGGPSQAAPVEMAAPVEGLLVTATENEVSIDWDPAPGATSYKVIQVAADGPAATVDDVAAPPAAFALAGLEIAAGPHGFCFTVQPAVDTRRVPSVLDLPVRCSDGSAHASVAELRSAP